MEEVGLEGGYEGVELGGLGWRGWSRRGLGFGVTISGWGRSHEAQGGGGVGWG